DGKSPVSLRLKSSTTELQAVEMVAVQRRADQEGDTTIFNAGAYKVNPDATAEDLVTKMPGITSSNGTIMAQGEKVTKVLLDGEEYFGGDAATVLKNLPAEVISKVQVFDKLSDQSQFTGFDDGNTDKTLNIITKEGMNRGVFGTATAGYGTDDRYAGSLSLNWFKDKQRVSLLAQANNINRQNFSSEDLTGLSSGNFTSGTQPGIINTNAIGLNYSNTIGKTKLTGSYFLNNQHGVNSSISERTTFLGDTSLQVANNTSDRISDNASHRLNFRFQTEFNKANSLIITPRLTIQNSSSSQLRTSEVLNGEGALLSGSNNDNRNGRNGLSFSNSLLFRRRFALKGRTFSANLTTSLSGRDGSGSLLARNRFSDDPGSENLVDQRNNIDNFTQNHGLQLRYTEPMGEKGQLQVALSPSVRLSDSEKLTYDRDPDAGTEALDARLSNKALNTVQSMRGGLSYRFKGEGYMFNFGLDGQTSSMHSEQTYPSRFSVDRSYANLLPNAMLSRNWGKLTRLRLMYRTNVSTPSINQLQTVVDNDDPLHLATGNLELDQSYSHAFTLRFNTMNSAKTRPFFALLSVQSQ
ncbi:MAG TPA: outer membrane beta-barrel protein, partial [Flavobacteriales bacterium]|nr:outer membrane beta-barrel protein [Flavobacteriales bacterium]